MQKTRSVPAPMPADARSWVGKKENIYERHRRGGRLYVPGMNLLRSLGDSEGVRDHFESLSRLADVNVVDDNRRHHQGHQ